MQHFLYEKVKQMEKENRSFYLKINDKKQQLWELMG